MDTSEDIVSFQDGPEQHDAIKFSPGKFNSCSVKVGRSFTAKGMPQTISRAKPVGLKFKIDSTMNKYTHLYSIKASNKLLFLET